VVVGSWELNIVVGQSGIPVPTRGLLCLSRLSLSISDFLFRLLD
jgi:hypothetical protein